MLKAKVYIIWLVYSILFIIFLSHFLHLLLLNNAHEESRKNWNMIILIKNLIKNDVKIQY